LLSTYRDLGSVPRTTRKAGEGGKWGRKGGRKEGRKEGKKERREKGKEGREGIWITSLDGIGGEDLFSIYFYA
jgi:hypothetical protein